LNLEANQVAVKRQLVLEQGEELGEENGRIGSKSVHQTVKRSICAHRKVGLISQITHYLEGQLESELEWERPHHAGVVNH